MHCVRVVNAVSVSSVLGFLFVFFRVPLQCALLFVGVVYPNVVGSVSVALHAVV